MYSLENITVIFATCLTRTKSSITVNPAEYVGEPQFFIKKIISSILLLRFGGEGFHSQLLNSERKILVNCFITRQIKN